MNLPRGIRFVRWIALAAIGWIFAAVPSFAAERPPGVHLGGRVGWARLVTPSAYWKRHAEYDRYLSDFIRQQIGLNMDPEWQSANPADLKQLCAYPVLFTNKLTDVVDRNQLANLQEYLRRGGFLIVDSCINRNVTRDPDEFLATHSALIHSLLPNATIRTLATSHPIYGVYFTMKDTPPHSFMDSVYDPKWARHGLYGVFEGERMVMLLSLSGLQCGWAHTQTGPRGIDVESMRMLVNIYVYAMTR